ncbi:MAG: hypothetical protein IPK50_20985 [Fibrobacterota bacterium]|nr:MAG: hypothetical protein IPK50_20985 [Fibrobacterota bacterium]
MDERLVGSAGRSFFRYRFANNSDDVSSANRMPRGYSPNAEDEVCVPPAGSVKDVLLSGFRVVAGMHLMNVG